MCVFMHLLPVISNLFAKETSYSLGKAGWVDLVFQCQLCHSPNTHSDSGQSSSIPRSLSKRINTRLQPDSPPQNYRRVTPDNCGTRITSLPNFNVESTPPIRLNPGLVSNEWSGISHIYWF